jgi:hypothetical protein
MVKWTGFQVSGDTGAPFACPNLADKSVQVEGIFGGATLTIEGSNMVDDPIFETLNDAEGNPLTFTSAGIRQVLENTYWVRPILSNADLALNTNLDIYLLAETTR